MTIISFSPHLKSRRIRLQNPWRIDYRTPRGVSQIIGALSFEWSQQFWKN